jgi:hypothetical protein
MEKGKEEGDHFEEIEPLAIDILSYWYLFPQDIFTFRFGGVEYWKRTSKDPPNCTAFWDDLYLELFCRICNLLSDGEKNGSPKTILRKK